ncbi:type II secretion system protein [bacterium]|nr:type II secretion system protein [bacterium]
MVCIEKEEGKVEGNKRSRKKEGFTLIEIVVAMVILIIAFGLITFLYVKAAKIRKEVVEYSEIQQILSQMMDTITHGKKGKWGLKDATFIRSIEGATEGDTPISPYTLIAYNETRDETMIVRIASEEELLGSGDKTKTLWVNWFTGSTPPMSSFYTQEALIDVNKKIELRDGSEIHYFDYRNRDILEEGISSETTFVKITLKGASLDPSMQNKSPVTLFTGIRLRNALPF